MIWVFLVLLVITNGATIFLLTRAIKRLLDFDFIWDSVVGELTNYEADLKKMSSGDLLIDNPDVLAFHKRNLRALKTLSAAVKQVVESRAPVPLKPALPRPEVE